MKPINDIFVNFLPFLMDPVNCSIFAEWVSSLDGTVLAYDLLALK